MELNDIEKKVDGSDLYLVKDGTDESVTDVLYFGFKLAEGKNISDFCQCFERGPARIDDMESLDVRYPARIDKLSANKFFSESPVYKREDNVFSAHDKIYHSLITVNSRFDEESYVYNFNTVELAFREEKGVVIGEIYYDKQANISEDSEGIPYDIQLPPVSVPVQDVWKNVVKKIARDIDNMEVLDRNVDKPVLFTADMAMALKWKDEHKREKAAAEVKNIAPETKVQEHTNRMTK